jgi:hypothetical protein
VQWRQDRSRTTRHSVRNRPACTRQANRDIFGDRDPPRPLVGSPCVIGLRKGEAPSPPWRAGLVRAAGAHVNLLGGLSCGAWALAASRVNVRPPGYRQSMRYLMLMWADADATSGDESDLQAWAEFDAQVKAAGAFVLNGALAPASTGARLVQTAIAGHAIDEAVERRPFAEGKRQIRPSTSWISPTWMPLLNGQTGCRPTAALRSARCCSSDLRGSGARPQPPSPIQPPTSGGMDPARWLRDAPTRRHARAARSIPNGISACGSGRSGCP